MYQMRRYKGSGCRVSACCVVDSVLSGCMVFDTAFHAHWWRCFQYLCRACVCVDSSLVCGRICIRILECQVVTALCFYFLFHSAEGLVYYCICG